MKWLDLWHLVARTKPADLNGAVAMESELLREAARSATRAASAYTNATERQADALERLRAVADLARRAGA